MTSFTSLKIAIRFNSNRVAPSTRTFSNTPTRAKAAIVTGSSREIGKAIALRLAKDGYDICVNDLNTNWVQAEEVAHTIETTYSRRATVSTGDVTSLPTLQRIVSHTVLTFGSLECMVANAGITQIKPLMELTSEDVQQMLDVNVRGVFNAYRAAAEVMKRDGVKGRLIGAASAASFRPFPLLGHYTASKFAVRGLTQAFALEMAPFGITCNAYAPGIVDTHMWDVGDREYAKRRGYPGFGKGDEGGGVKEELEKGEMTERFVREMVPVGRVSVPEDVARLVSWLASEESEYVTGQTMSVDGGIVFN